MISKIKKNYGGLPLGIYILFTAQVINRIGGFVYAFLALYMSSKLGYDAGQIANFVIINAAFSMISPFLGGHLADKKGRKTILLVASTLGAIMFIVCGFVTDKNPQLVPYLLIIASIFLNFTGPIYNAMVADMVPGETQRKRAYALIYLGINLGVAIGPILGGYLLANYVHWFFFGDAITSLISLMLIAIFVKETLLTKEEMEQSTGQEKLESGSTAKIFFKRPVLVMYTIFSLTASFVYAQHGYGMSLHIQHFFGEVVGPQHYGLLMSFNAVVVLLFTITITEAMSRFRTIHSLTIGSMLYATGFGLLFFAKGSIYLYFISVFIWTIGEIIMITNGNVFIMSNTPVNHRGRFSAIIGFIRGTGYVISPKVISYVILYAGYAHIWSVIALIATIGSFGFFLTGIAEKRQSDMAQKSA